MNKYTEQIKKILNNKTAVIFSLILFKLIFQLIVIKSGLKWLTADDYSRTVISWDWLQHPHIYSGVWLSPHFWLNGIMIWIFKDLTLAPVITSTVFSVLTLIYLYLIFQKIFTHQIAVISCLIYTVFPFQVWLSTSAMPEFPFFFFITASIYYFLLWYDGLNRRSKSHKYLIVSAVLLNFANVLRYEGWFFTIAFVIMVVLLSYRKFRFQKELYINFAWSCISFIGIFWWIWQNYHDYNDMFYFIKETTKIYTGLSSAGLIQRSIQYPFFIFYIAPLTTILGLWKAVQTIRKKHNGFKGSFYLLRIFLLLNILELLLLMFSGIVGSGGTNMISRYIVLNAILFFPFAVWQLCDLKWYIFYIGAAVLVIVNIIWSFYYQQAYRDDTYEVAELTRQLIDIKYLEPGDKIYFEMVQGYYDIYPLQVISNDPSRFNTDTIPTYFAVEPPVSKKTSKKKNEEEQLKLNILEVRKFIEQKKIKLFIVRSDLLIDKLTKLSYKSETIGDYRIFYISDRKIYYKRSGENDSTGDLKKISNGSKQLGEDEISFDRKLVLSEFRIDNSNFGVNPQTVTLKWQIADASILDSLNTDIEEFGRYKAHLELTPIDNDSAAFDTYANIFSERNVEEFFDTEEIKNILIIKPFAMLNYSIKFKTSPFESGLYDVRLSVYDEVKKDELPVYIGDSLYIHKYEFVKQNDSIKVDSTVITKKAKEHRNNFLKRPYYPIGRIIAMFPNVNYSAVMKKSSDLSKVIIRNGFMLPFLNRYQGDHMLDIVFTYF
ncbi:MAG: glycosyltransferase family 39 protein [Ignavibacteria bacterium]|nr:glycosyltransferase family 39 protein [Ignavibacteria bacterium]